MHSAFAWTDWFTELHTEWLDFISMCVQEKGGMCAYVRFYHWSHLPALI